MMYAGMKQVHFSLFLHCPLMRFLNDESVRYSLGTAGSNRERRKGREEKAESTAVHWGIDSGEQGSGRTPGN